MTASSLTIAYIFPFLIFRNLSPWVCIETASGLYADGISASKFPKFSRYFNSTTSPLPSGSGGKKSRKDTTWNNKRKNCPMKSPQSYGATSAETSISISLRNSSLLTSSIAVQNHLIATTKIQRHWRWEWYSFSLTAQVWQWKNWSPCNVIFPDKAFTFYQKWCIMKL